MAIQDFNMFLNPTQEDSRRTRKEQVQSAVSSMAAPSQPDKQKKDPAQQDAIRRRIKKRNLSEDPYQNRPQGQ